MPMKESGCHTSLVMIVLCSNPGVNTQDNKIIIGVN